MCAINGFNFKDERLVRGMNAVTGHRGPDGTGVFLGDGVSLGHNRLAIIDTSDAAAQPMKSCDGNFTIVFNGEIYNFKELKRELADRYSFRTWSDTEVILAAYREWGASCVGRMNGIFAFAIWDAREKSLFLARDPAGVKPLYYFWNGKTFIFSSEIKAILSHGIPRILDREAFNHYLRVLYVPEPLTMFAGIRKLPPESFATLRGVDLTIESYRKSERKADIAGTKRAAARLVKDAVCGAVRRQLVSDKPLGVYLSGGIDSSIVLHAMAREQANIDTFSVGFDLPEESQREKFNADFNLARRTAAHYCTRHHEVFLSPSEVPALFEDAVRQMDEPISNPTALSMLKLARFAKQKVDVVLGGDGGDELFGGYERYRLSIIAHYWQKLPKIVRNVAARNSLRLKKLNTPADISRYALFMFQKDAVLKRVIRDDVLDEHITGSFFEEKYFSEADSRPFEERLMEADRRSWLPDFSLMLTDKMTMSAGLEARVPFLDNEVVALAERIPFQYKTRLWGTKIILKEAFRRDIPEYLFGQPKRGWFSPAAKWLRDDTVYRMAENILSSGYYAETAPLFKSAAAREMLARHRASEEYNLVMLWALLTFQIWARGYNIRI